jgi:hypothetical protein
MAASWPKIRFRISNTKKGEGEGTVVPMLSEAPCHEGVWRCAEFRHILSLGIRCRRVVSFIHGPLYSVERGSGTHCTVGEVGCTVGLDTLRLPGIKSGLHSHPREVDMLVFLYIYFVDRASRYHSF